MGIDAAPAPHLHQNLHARHMHFHSARSVQPAPAPHIMVETLDKRTIDFELEPLESLAETHDKYDHQTPFVGDGGDVPDFLDDMLVR